MFQTKSKITLSSNTPDDFIKAILSNCTSIKLPKSEFILKRGDAQSKFYYVQKGLLRYYSIDEKGKEHILQFAPEGWFISDRQSACLNLKSDFFIDALEDSELMMISEAYIINLTKSNQEFLELNNKLLQNHIRQLQNRINQLLSYTAEERYLEFVKTYPDILLRVPQWMVASYLGITPESLSRVRKELAEKNQKKK
ncbi:MAG TPA: Crp/Fnr family transcriptional regulator [Niabella sp.]|nr:Crp/Fnr family transcriptional regulator [Chitinophagaceae bacterium]HRN48433.1 Crp/Fnr family transcriptional regulator [Niabella sp.]HRO83267.1 Crp/Fnr family transcriptional regulator [Niabella sp.]